MERGDRTSELRFKVEHRPERRLEMLDVGSISHRAT